MLQIVFPAPSRFCAIWPPAPRLFSLFSHDAALHLTPASADLVGYLYTQRIRVSLMMQTFGQMDCGGVWRCLEFTAEGRNAWNFQFLVPGKTAVGVLTPAAIWLPQVNSLLFFSCFFFYVPLPEYDLWLDGGSVEIIHESEVNLSLQSCEQCIRLQVAKQRLGSYLQFYFFTFTDQTWYAK